MEKFICKTISCISHKYFPDISIVKEYSNVLEFLFKNGKLNQQLADSAVKHRGFPY